ncbi:hypothetical protein JZ751_005228 [Albula glossodonta]|uniref:Hemimethylated DNA-binding domain-containing protein n=1 Tax=Albula glossodonta TaxID=121402 RepID=A0A8T2P7J7_9TELE|nr:hypothetical protein JZ751_005228 [Albula glossodonta]
MDNTALLCTASIIDTDVYNHIREKRGTVFDVAKFFAAQEDDSQGESPALEVLMHDNDQGYFGASKEVRSPRPLYVLHRVGQVVMEKNNHMVGVIVSWDHRLKAPPEWTKKMYSSSETSLELLTGFQPDIPTLNMYFSHFDGKKFVMQSWLQELFPED